MSREDRNTLIASLVGILFFLGLAFEIAGFRTDWWHSISYYAYHSPALRWGIAVAMVLTLILWLVHSGHPIPKAVRGIVVNTLNGTATRGIRSD